MTIRSMRWGVTGCTLVVLAGGCTSIGGPSPSLIPNKALTVSRSLSLPMDTIALAAVAVVVVDPLAPNWHVEQRALGDGRFAFALTKKRFTTGGDGEALPVLRRRIEQLGRESGFSSHVLLEYTEGIESTMPIAQRVVRAVVQYAAAPVAVNK